MRSIRTKLIVYFSILILLISVVFGVISLKTTEGAVTREVELALELLAENSAALIKSQLDVDLARLQTIATRDDLIGMDWELQQPLLARELERGTFRALGILDLDGRGYFSNGLSVDLSNADYEVSQGDGSYG